MLHCSVLRASLVEPSPEAEVAQQSVEQRHRNQDAQLEEEIRVVYPHVVQQNLRVVKVTVHFVAIEPLPVVTEHDQHDGHDAAADKGHPHQPLHDDRNLRRKVEPVDGQPEEGGDRERTNRGSILKLNSINLQTTKNKNAQKSHHHIERSADHQSKALRAQRYDQPDQGKQRVTEQFGRKASQPVHDQGEDHVEEHLHG